MLRGECMWAAPDQHIHRKPGQQGLFDGGLWTCRWSVGTQQRYGGRRFSLCATKSTWWPSWLERWYETLWKKTTQLKTCDVLKRFAVVTCSGNDLGVNSVENTQRPRSTSVLETTSSGAERCVSLASPWCHSAEGCTGCAILDLCTSIHGEWIGFQWFNGGSLCIVYHVLLDWFTVGAAAIHLDIGEEASGFSHSETTNSKIKPSQQMRESFRATQVYSATRGSDCRRSDGCNLLQGEQIQMLHQPLSLQLPFPKDSKDAGSIMATFPCQENMVMSLVGRISWGKWMHLKCFEQDHLMSLVIVTAENDEFRIPTFSCILFQKGWIVMAMWEPLAYVWLQVEPGWCCRRGRCFGHCAYPWCYCAGALTGFPRGLRVWVI